MGLDSASSVCTCDFSTLRAVLGLGASTSTSISASGSESEPSSDSALAGVAFVALAGVAFVALAGALAGAALVVVLALATLGSCSCNSSSSLTSSSSSTSSISLITFFTALDTDLATGLVEFLHLPGVLVTTASSSESFCSREISALAII